MSHRPAQALEVREVLAKASRCCTYSTAVIGALRAPIAIDAFSSARGSSHDSDALKRRAQSGRDGPRPVVKISSFEGCRDGHNRLDLADLDTVRPPRDEEAFLVLLAALNTTSRADVRDRCARVKISCRSPRTSRLRARGSLHAVASEQPAARSSREGAGLALAMTGRSSRMRVRAGCDAVRVPSS